MTPKQIKFVRGLLSKLGMAESKDDIVLNHSNGRTTHLSELNYNESKSLIDFLANQAKVPPSPKDKQIRKILFMCHEMRWELPGGKINMDRINNFCLTRTAQKKPLDQFTAPELPALVTIFEKVYNDYLKGL